MICIFTKIQAELNLVHLVRIMTLYLCWL